MHLLSYNYMGYEPGHSLPEFSASGFLTGLVQIIPTRRGQHRDVNTRRQKSLEATPKAAYHSLP